jgi:hypothetical protein
MTDNLNIFRKEFLGADSWEQRKDGVPLYLLDAMSADELQIAEGEMIRALGPGDGWPVSGLGHIRSQQALPSLYALLPETAKGMKITIAHAIFQISGDQKMIDIALEEISGISNVYELIRILHFLAGFKDERTTAALHRYRNHEEYLVAYNATRYLGLPTDAVVKKFRKKNAQKERKNFWRRWFG